MKRCLLTTILLASTGAVPACGSLDTRTDEAPVLATIQGQLTNPDSLATQGNVRVAVVWEAGTPGQFNVAEDLPVQPVFPSSFSIQLDGPPPASAMTNGSSLYGGSGAEPTQANGAAASSEDAGQGAVILQDSPVTTASNDFALAIGIVVAYLDKNGNGKLDLVPNGASGYVDQILATSGNDFVVYMQGTIPAGAVDPLGHQPAEGYNIGTVCDSQAAAIQSAGSLCPAPEDAGAAATCNNQWLPITTSIVLSVSNDPLVSSLMCLSNADSSSTSSGGAAQSLPGRPATYPAPCDPNLYCADDGSSYTYTTCTTVQQGLCEGTNETCATTLYSRPSPVPSDWPCVP